jgi:hypothetical protein
LVGTLDAAENDGDVPQVIQRLRDGAHAADLAAHLAAVERDAARCREPTLADGGAAATPPGHWRAATATIRRATKGRAVAWPGYDGIEISGKRTPRHGE